VLKTFEHASYDNMVFQANIPTWSMCMHHLAPFWGLTHIGYIPNGKVVGLSKLARLVDIFARRLQIQEQLGCQIADSLMEHLGCLGAGVVMQCRHSCMESRGVQKQGTITITSALRGVVKDHATARSEFMSLVGVAVQGARGV
jgi:GTP cyclohydrolase I